MTLSTKLLRVLLTAFFGPVLLTYDAVIATPRFCLRPFDWVLRKVNPTYAADIKNKQKQITN